MPNYFSVLPSHFLFNQDSLGEDSLNLHHFMEMSENIVETWNFQCSVLAEEGGKTIPF